MRTDNQHQEPTLAEVIQVMIDSNLIDLHVCLPGKIVKYDSSTQMATIQPSLLKMNENFTVPYPWPPVPKVPIVFPRAVSGQAFIHMPLIPGDDVVMVVSERSLDNWKQTGILTDPADRRKFNISDAFAFPGGSGEPFAFEVDDDKAIEIKNLLSLLQVKPTGEFNFENDIASISLSPTGTFTLDAPLVNLGSNASHGAGLGDVIENRLSALESALSSFITAYTAHMHPTAAPGPPSPPIIPGIPFIAVPIPAASNTVKVST